MPQTTHPLPIPIPVSGTVPVYQTTTTTEIDVLMQTGAGDYDLSSSMTVNDDLDRDVGYLVTASHSDLSSTNSKIHHPHSSPGSVTTGTLSFVTLGTEGTPSVVTEDVSAGSVSGSANGIGGYVMVSHRRTYSEKSDRTSDGGEGRLYSTPDEGEWIGGTGVEGWGREVMQRQETLIVEEVADEDLGSSSMPHDPKLVLYSLGTNGMPPSFFLLILDRCCRCWEDGVDENQNQEQ